MTEETKKQAFEKVSNSIADITHNNYSTDLLIFSKGYQVAVDEANKRIQKLRGALVEIECGNGLMGDVSRNEKIAYEALKEDDLKST